MRIVFRGLLSVALFLGCSRSDGKTERGKDFPKWAKE